MLPVRSGPLPFEASSADQKRPDVGMAVAYSYPDKGQWYKHWTKSNAMNASLQIAVADDEPVMRSYFLKILPRMGHQVVCAATTGRELVEQCSRLHPDLVITDINMPDMNGLDAAANLYRSQAIPVILISAQHADSLIGCAESDHIIAFLLKPIKQTDLESVLTIAVRRCEPVQAKRQSGTYAEAGSVLG
jgi:response regulator NasT